MIHNYLLIAMITFFAVCLACAIAWVVRRPREPRDPWRDTWQNDQRAYLEEVLEHSLEEIPRLTARRILAASWARLRAVPGAVYAWGTAHTARTTRRLARPAPRLAIEAAPRASAMDLRVQAVLERADRSFEDTDTMLRAIR